MYTVFASNLLLSPLSAIFLGAMHYHLFVLFFFIEIEDILDLSNTLGRFTFLIQGFECLTFIVPFKEEVFKII